LRNTLTLEIPMSAGHPFPVLRVAGKLALSTPKN